MNKKQQIIQKMKIIHAKMRMQHLKIILMVLIIQKRARTYIIIT